MFRIGSQIAFHGCLSSPEKESIQETNQAERQRGTQTKTSHEEGKVEIDFLLQFLERFEGVPVRMRLTRHGCGRRQSMELKRWTP